MKFKAGNKVLEDVAYFYLQERNDGGVFLMASTSPRDTYAILEITSEGYLEKCYGMPSYIKSDSSDRIKEKGAD